MAEFSFWAAEEDRIKIINAILAFGSYSLVPDLNYPDSQPEIYTSPEDSLFEATTKKKRLYIIGPYSEAPVSLRQIKSGACDGGYYVDEARGGPLLVLSLPGCKIVDGMTELTPGDFFHRTEYWDDATTRPIKPSDELKNHYGILLKEIKRHLVREHIGQTVWMGQHASELLNADKAIILSSGKWWDGRGNFIKSNLNQTSTR